MRRSKQGEQAADDQLDLFADFNGLPDDNARTEFYRHDANWSNRMILGDSLQVMASLAEREGLRGKVQCIYLDPPYGIKFNSNFQWSTTSRDVRDGKAEHITREPEQVKAFRDTWRDGIHSYLTYLRDRLTVARDLLTESGSIFVQIGNENVHCIRALMDEIMGKENYVGTIVFQKTGSIDQFLIPQTVDYLLVFAREIDRVKYRQLHIERERGTTALERYDMVLMEDGTTRRITRGEATSGVVKTAVRCRLTSLSSARPREWVIYGVSATRVQNTLRVPVLLSRTLKGLPGSRRLAVSVPVVVHSPISDELTTSVSCRSATIGSRFRSVHSLRTSYKQA